MNISKDNINGVKNLPGVNLTSCIVPCTDEDNYPTHDSFYGKGGWREVRTVEERDAIPQERRKVGMAVRVTSINKTYILKYGTTNYCWYEENPTNVEDIINDAISKGAITVDFTNCVMKDELMGALIPYLKTTVCESMIDKAVTDVKAWVEEQEYLKEHQSLEGYATEEWVEEQGYLTEHQSLEDYATIECVKEGFELVKEGFGDVQQKLEEINENHEELKTVHFKFEEETNKLLEQVNADLAEIKGALGAEDGENQSFATKDELLEAINKVEEELTAVKDDVQNISDTYLSTTEAALQYATIDNLNESVKSLKNSMKGFATVDDMLQATANAGYITKAFLKGFATEFYVQDYVASAMAGKIKPGQALVDYSAEIADLKAQVKELAEKLNNLLD